MLAIPENFPAPKSHASEAAKLLMDERKVKITKTTRTKGIAEYSGLLSISDVLNRYIVENPGILRDPNKGDEAPLPL
ncbi:hypothetical protein [Chitinophaga nivalis]|uniref:Uncharacterized protein n=1 Tax=Chitinophaga nivalis TaxID=2991709 RepID=A0ABT3IET8_9BACT|nr:hypothetical protein [Chitinophaga nivalis]MCW3467826.1 hypothetical protein [Chitinophaga nivalis]MCW3482482.1 hypothetical protein [Chitinophaga nivalis]